ncbi:tetratricopeptide repeat protein [Ramlibacter sp.]|uniref:tetratricopeptide repeat protein n=1 Tax=Ramlibacter sp. TaxID=1917967 RepID=UPI003D0ABDDE
MATSVDARLSRLQTFLEADPDNPLLLCDLADLHLQSAHKDDARPYLERALKLRPHDPRATYMLAVLEYFAGRLAESEALTAQLLAQEQQSPAIRHQHACTLAKLGDFAQALPLIERLLEEHVGLPGLDALHVRALHAQGRLAQVHVPETRNVEARVERGMTLLALDEPREAARVLGSAAELAPGDGSAWLGWGLADLMTGDLGAARTRLDNAVSRMPEHLGARNALAWTQILQNDLDGATATLEACQARDDTFAETWGCLAVVAALQARWDDAGELCRTALRLQADSFSARAAQALLEGHRGRHERAVPMLRALFGGMGPLGQRHFQDMVRRLAQEARAPGDSTMTTTTTTTTTKKEESNGLATP